MNEMKNGMYEMNMNLCCYIRIMIWLFVINANNHYWYYSMNKYLEIINKFIISIICNGNNGYSLY